jgi:methyl-accepting chemotaxis protein
VRADIEFSAPLDIVFPIVLQGFEGEVGGGDFDPIAIMFLSTSGVRRSYPSSGIYDLLPADADFTDRMAALGPVGNPDRRTVWTPPYEGIAGQGLLITAMTPVYAGDTFRGSLEVDISFDRVVGAVNGVKPTPGGFAFYVDSNGVLARTDAFDLLSGEAETNPQLAALLASMRLGEPIFPLPVEKLELGGQEFLVSYTPSGGPGGSIAAAAPVSDVTAQAALITAGISDEGTRTLWIMLAALGGLFVAGLAAATYLNRPLLVWPLHRLTSATRQVAGGDLTVNVALGRNDELGALASDFNVMVEQLRESERVLEQRVDDRTR